MSPIDKSINLIGDILNCASLHFVHAETKQGFLRVVNTIKCIKLKLIKSHKKIEEEQEM